MIPKGEKPARKQVLDVAQEMAACGLSPGRSGNVSIRWDDGMLITPSGMRYDAMELEDIVRVDHAGTPDDPGQIPSSEWRFHLDALKARPDQEAVVHTHSMHATALACAGRRIPAFHYMVAVAGGTDIPIVPYALFGTAALSKHVNAGLKERNACLMKHHGQVALGKTPAAALELAREVESLAQQYCITLTLGAPKLLTASQMKKVLAKFTTYGANTASSD